MLRPDDRADFVGDLDEEHLSRVAAVGGPDARRWYWRQALHSIPSLVWYRLHARRRPTADTKGIPMWSTFWKTCVTAPE